MGSIALGPYALGPDKRSRGFAGEMGRFWDASFKELFAGGYLQVETSALTGVTRRKPDCGFAIVVLQSEKDSHTHRGHEGEREPVSNQG